MLECRRQAIIFPYRPHRAATSKFPRACNADYVGLATHRANGPPKQRSALNCPVVSKNETVSRLPDVVLTEQKRALARHVRQSPDLLQLRRPVVSRLNLEPCTQVK